MTMFLARTCALRLALLPGVLLVVPAACGAQTAGELAGTRARGDGMDVARGVASAPHMDAATAAATARRESATPTAARLHGAATDAQAAARATALLQQFATGSDGATVPLHGLRLIDARAAMGGVIYRFALANGLQLVLLPDDKARLVAFHTWVRVGSAHEEAGKTGLAHLLEHLMFKASARFPAGAFDRVLERMGASPNAATWLDWTMYHETIVSDALATVAAMEADRLCFLKLNDAALRSELDVVRSERREVVDTDPEGKLEEAFSAALWGKGIGYGHPTVGRGPDLRKLALPDVLGFYRKWYRPGRVAVVLVGAVDLVRDLPILARIYGPLPAQGEVTADAPGAAVDVAPFEVQARPLEVKLDAGADRLLVGWRAMPGDHVDHPVLTLLAELLANADVARLGRALIEDGRLAVDVDLDAPSLARGGALELRVRLRPGIAAETALARIDAEIAALAGDRPLTEAELAGARNRLRAARLAQMVTVDGRAEAIGHDFAAFEEPSLSEAWWRRVETATLADVRRVAIEVLRVDRRAVVIGRAARGGAAAGVERR